MTGRSGPNTCAEAEMIEGYLGRESVVPGGELAVHVSTDAARFRLRFYRLGEDVDPVAESGWLPGALHLPPPHPDGLPGRASPADDWGWPALTLPVPGDWSPGMHLVQFVAEGEDPPRVDAANIEGPAREFFVVRPERAGSRSRILYKKSTFTRHAYNRSDRPGEERAVSLYDHPAYLREGTRRGHKVSLHRPGGVIDLAYWDAPFIAWLERHGYPVEFCTDLDLHENPELLSDYNLLLSVGHDEYWSEAMREHAEGFVRAGGNIAFLSANTCWWRIHPTDRNTAFVSDTDHHVGEEYPHLPATDQWWPPAPDGVGRPENSLTGVSFRNGGMWASTEWPGDRPREGYTVQHAEHWIYADTGLRDGDRLGAGTPLIGYECDGAAYARDARGVARSTGEDGTPASFLILGIHVLEPVHEDFHRFAWGHWNGPAREPGVTSPRAATMGLYTADGTGGTVFTAGTTDWPVVCGREQDAGVVRVTRNLLDRLRHRRPHGSPHA
ncbi:N,N-dimethylformamidase beta subunit family domain-containing protein [Streptomyces rubellomurinus]|uniref:N,N-dimethylformamidase beta subunit family domain-containing protein n=1 Tax=Streptomyces rubellomurinus (strain ATCC 31215) TaxID=359131 RepID=UPI001FC9707B|nr:N,N-dimethylformamidase beta subunit family domain-containing protein [Streptomyces rubellomurinus]